MLKLLGVLDLFVAVNFVLIAFGMQNKTAAIFAMVYVIIKIFVFPLPLVNLIDLAGAITGIVFTVISAGTNATILLILFAIWFAQKGIASFK